MSSPRCGSHASGASLPKIDSNCVASSTATGTSIGPDAAKPTKPATSMRGRTSGDGGACASNRMPGSLRRVCCTAALLHLEPLVRERELLHRDVRALRVHRAADVFD